MARGCLPPVAEERCRRTSRHRPSADRCGSLDRLRDRTASTPASRSRSRSPAGPAATRTARSTKRAQTAELLLVGDASGILTGLLLPADNTTTCPEEGAKCIALTRSKTVEGTRQVKKNHSRRSEFSERVTFVAGAKN